jgi:4-hydroxy-tetrahydrodipicolinate reductase
MIRVVLAGVTGWVGRALLPAVVASDDFKLVAAVSRKAAGRDAGEAIGSTPLGVTVSATMAEALATPSDVVVDYTKPDSVGRNTLEAIAAGRHVVVGASGLGADDYAAIDKAAREKNVGVLAAGNFSITATLLKRFALEAARYVPDVEIIDYASAGKPDAPSGTGRELAEALSLVRGAATSRPVDQVGGIPATRGAAVGDGANGACGCMRCACRPSCCRWRPCSVPTTSVSCCAMMPEARLRLTWPAHCSRSAVSPRSPACGADSIV